MNNNFTKIFLLFEMDGVLLHPCGYYRALIDSVNSAATALGVKNVRFTRDHIAHFEGLNITNERDSLAICVAFMLISV